MSHSSNQKLRFWEDLEEHLRGTVFYHSGIKLSQRDNETFAVAILLQGMCLEDTLTSSSPDRRPRIIRWCKTIHKIDVLDLATFLKEMTLYFRNYRDTWSSSYSDFKHQYQNVYPFIGEFFSPIKEEVGEFLNSPSSTSFSILSQHVSFIAKLSLRDLDYSSKSMSDYLATEDMLRHFEFDTTIVEQLNRIAREWFSEFRYEEFLPRHGNGAVALLGKSSILEKYSEFHRDVALDYFLKTFDSDLDSWFPMPLKFGPFRKCQVQFVPKSIQSWRTISAEPAVLQFFQQGIARSLDRYMSSHIVMNRHIDLHDQNKNRVLACDGSAFRSYATIDLSNASDCVSWDLVKAVFHGTPLLRGFYATRSKEALLPSGKSIELAKFAPMGSALCFPVECIIFALICEYVVRQQSVSSFPSDYSVYGDDIVIRTEYAHEVLDALTGCGFTFSPGKSFISAAIPFRESCGGEYFSGDDVTPMRLSRKFSNDLPSQWNPGAYEAHVAGANLAQQHNLPTVRLWFIHRLMLLPQDLLPLFSNENNGSHLYSSQATNFHLKKEWNVDWQCDLLRCGAIMPRHTRKNEVEHLRLFEWLRTTSQRVTGPQWPGECVETTTSRPATRLSSRLVSNS